MRFNIYYVHVHDCLPLFLCYNNLQYLYNVNDLWYITATHLPHIVFRIQLSNCFSFFTRNKYKFVLPLEKLKQIALPIVKQNCAQRLFSFFFFKWQNEFVKPFPIYLFWNVERGVSSDSQKNAIHDLRAPRYSHRLPLLLFLTKQKQTIRFGHFIFMCYSKTITMKPFH